MQESNMTEQDWEAYMTEWESSFTPINPDLMNYDISAEITKPEQPEARKGQQSVPYIRKGRSSAKAQFYITEDSMSGIYGFWCPKKVVDRESNTHVDIPDWFELKIVEFF